MADEQQQNLDQKLDGLDDNLRPLNKDDSNAKPAVKEEKATDKTEEAKEDDSKEAAEDGDDKKESAEDSKGTDTGESESEKEEDDGYTIDEGEEEDEEAPSVSTKPADKSQLTAEQQYILDNVSPIKVRGTVNGSDKVQEFEVLAPEQLPSGFKFADDVEMAKANKNFNMLEQRATQLQQDFRTQETDKAAKEFKTREDTADRQDIAKLQKEGTLPKFKAQPDSKEFDKDPGVQLVQEILDFKDKKNAQYLEEYNAGRPYKHIGFEEANAMFKRENPQDVKQAKEDKERVDLAKRTARPSGNGSQEAAQKARIHSGMSSRDLDNLIENLDWS